MNSLKDIIRQSNRMVAHKIYVPKGLRKYVETETINGMTRLKKKQDYEI